MKTEVSAKFKTPVISIMNTANYICTNCVCESVCFGANQMIGRVCKSSAAGSVL